MTTKKTRCTATTKAGTRCKHSARAGTSPPRCHLPSHISQRKVGAPLGNKNAETHGYYSALPETDSFEININNLERKLADLDSALDDAKDDLSPLDYAKACDLQGRLTSRIEYLKRRHREEQGQADEIQDSLHEALKLVWETLDIENPKKEKGPKS